MLDEAWKTYLGKHAFESNDGAMDLGNLNCIWWCGLFDKGWS